MTRNWRGLLPRKLRAIGNAEDYDTGTFYFYTDGCLMSTDRNYGSWSVVGIEHKDGWQEVFNASASEVPACDSGQMELLAINTALRAAMQYPGRPICLRTDHQGLQKTVARYLGTYTHAFKGDEAEATTKEVRARMRAGHKGSKAANDYNELFDILDRIGSLGIHHSQQFKIEWVPRDSDQWIKRADREARSANMAGVAK